MSIYTSCIKPHSINIALFTNREGEYHHTKEILKSIILAHDDEERRLLIHGDRGTGKSMLLTRVSHPKIKTTIVGLHASKISAICWS